MDLADFVLLEIGLLLGVLSVIVFFRGHDRGDQYRRSPG